MSGPSVTRRCVLKGTGALAALPLLPRMADAAAAGGERHGLSAFGDLKYPPDFAHFDYVNPDAPKGGVLSTVPSSWGWNQSPLTFNTLNTLVLRGDAPVGLDIIYDSLMTRATDEPDAVYGLVARSVRISGDGNLYTFLLRPEARFHDGSPLTADDVVFSLLTLKEKGHPAVSQSIRDMVEVSRDGDRAVTVRLAEDHSRGLPMLVASLPIVSRAWYDTRDFAASTLERPLASGPYKVGAFEPGRFIEYKRVGNYWARDLPVNRGRFNFDIYRVEFFRDRDVAFEAFKAKTYLLREEFSSKSWATQYDFPAIADGRVVQDTIPDNRPSGAQGYFLNTRRPQFSDRRVREALIYAFDFEWANENLFYGLYKRTHSFFQNSDMMAQGEPGDAELALLEPYRGQVPDEVFGEPFSPPVTDGSGRDRRSLRHAKRLLQEAGWTVSDGALRNAAGKPFTIEFLEDDPSFERVTMPYVRRLERLGIQARIRTVDPAQFQSRLKDFDYDVVVRRYAMPQTPDEGIKRFWSSADADVPGSDNLSGIKDPVVDALTETMIRAKTREEMVAAARALDRVLRAGRYWVPHWYKGTHTLAYWDAFERPETKPAYERGIVTTWWSRSGGDAAGDGGARG